MSNDYAKNLAYLCELEPSVTELCRRLQINRQQFARYLSGEHRPSRRNDRKIRDYFGISDAELNWDHSKFIGYYAEVTPPKLPDREAYLDEILRCNKNSLRTHLGFYYIYFFSFAWKNYVMKSLACIYESDSRFFIKSIERIRDPASGHRFVLKYDGCVTMMSDRINIVKKSMMSDDTLFLTMLYRSYRAHPVYLSGLTLGSSSHSSREPSAARTVFQYLGQTIDVRSRLRKCGIFLPNSSAVAPQILPYITNQVADGEHTLSANPMN